jgi:hypothetical protein
VEGAVGESSPIVRQQDRSRPAALNVERRAIERSPAIAPRAPSFQDPATLRQQTPLREQPPLRSQAGPVASGGAEWRMPRRDPGEADARADRLRAAYGGTPATAPEARSEPRGADARADRLRAAYGGTPRAAAPESRPEPRMESRREAREAPPQRAPQAAPREQPSRGDSGGAERRAVPRDSGSAPRRSR